MARLEFANALRGLAALSVVIAHYNSFFFGSASLIGTIANTPPPIREASPALDAWQWVVLSLPFAGGEFGVALFFLISGFVIPMSLQKYDWRGFLVGRILRIYPTYFAGFSVTLFALLIAGGIFGKPFPFDARAVVIHFLPGVRDLAWSPHIDFVVWTLEIEIKFYIVCAVAWKWLRHGDRRVFAIPLAMAGCAIGIEALLPGWLTSHAFAYRLGYLFTTTSRFFALMFIGVAFFYHHRRRLGTGALGAMSLTLFALFWVLSSKAPTAADLHSWQVVRSDVARGRSLCYVIRAFAAVAAKPPPRVSRGCQLPAVRGARRRRLRGAADNGCAQCRPGCRSDSGVIRGIAVELASAHCR